MIIRNNIIPFKGYKLMAVWPFIFARKNANIKDVDLNHEKIHFKQQGEMLLILFYAWYGVEWLIKAIKYKSFDKAYENISFEREAYTNEKNLEYLNNRKWYSWFKYI